MAWEFSVLVVANVTAGSDELLSALRERSETDSCRFTLLIPAAGRDARARLEAALARMKEAGLERVSGTTGDQDPVVAVMEAWDPAQYDEIIVSTLPSGASRWLGADLPHRLERLTSVPVRHVVSTPRPEVHTEPAPERERHGVLAPLMAALTRR